MSYNSIVAAESADGHLAGTASGAGALGEAGAGAGTPKARPTSRLAVVSITSARVACTMSLWLIV